MFKRYFAFFLALVLSTSCLISCEKDENDMIEKNTSVPTAESTFNNETAAPITSIIPEQTEEAGVEENSSNTPNTSAEPENTEDIEPDNTPSSSLSPDATEATATETTSTATATEDPETNPEATQTVIPSATTGIVPTSVVSSEPTDKATVKPTVTAKPAVTTKPVVTAKPVATSKPTATLNATAKPTVTAKPTSKPTATPKPTAVPTSTPATKTYVWVVCNSLYVRDNSVLASGNKLGVAKYGTRFEVIEKADTYTKIVYNGDVAYISAKPEYVSFTEPPEVTPSPEPTAPPKTYVWIVCSTINIRDNSNLSQGNILGTANKGASFEVLERAETYTKIVYKNGVAYISAKPENVTFTDPNITLTAHQKEVIRKIMYAVETGGQVYGNASYSDFTEAYTNTPEEHAITIGAGAWYATEAKRLLNLIRTTDPELFAQLDTAGIGYDLDNADWSTYKLSKTSAKAKCIQSIINTSVGRACQDQLIDEQMVTYMAKAKALGVTDIDALMMCANIHHLGGLGALKRILAKTTQPYTLDNIYAALQTDTEPNQVGMFKNRHKMVYNSLKKYL